MSSKGWMRGWDFTNHYCCQSPVSSIMEWEYREHTMEITEEEKNKGILPLRGLTVPDASQGSAAGNHDTLTCSHRSQPWPFVCKHPAGRWISPGQWIRWVCFSLWSAHGCLIPLPGSGTLSGWEQGTAHTASPEVPPHCHHVPYPQSRHHAHLMDPHPPHSHITPSHSPMYRDLPCFYTPRLKNPYFLPLFLH